MLLTLNPVVTANRAPWPEIASIAHHTGFAGVEIPITKALESTPAACLAILRANNVLPGAISLPVDIRKDDLTFEKDLATLPQASAFAAAISCPRMGTWLLSSAEIPKPEQRKLMLQRIRKVAAILERDNVRLGLEFLGPLHIRKRFPHEFIWQMNEMLAFARECGPNCGLMLDSWHWHHSGATPEDIVKAGRAAIVHVHLADAPNIPPEKILDNERLIPGEGVLNWKGFFGALKEIGYQDAISPEVFGRGLKDMPVVDACQLVHDKTVQLMQTLKIV